MDILGEVKKRNVSHLYFDHLSIFKMAGYLVRRAVINSRGHRQLSKWIGLRGQYPIRASWVKMLGRVKSLHNRPNKNLGRKRGTYFHQMKIKDSSPARRNLSGKFQSEPRGGNTDTVPCPAAMHELWNGFANCLARLYSTAKSILNNRLPKKTGI